MAHKVTENTLSLLKYHEAYPEVNYRRLGELFGITRQRVSQIIKRGQRDRMVIEYMKRHPGVSPGEVGEIFGIRSIWRVRSLMPEEEN